MKRISILLLAATSFAVPACSNDVDQPGAGDDDDDVPGDDTPGGNLGDLDKVLASRVTDYNAALRIAALRLTGALPNMTDITAVSQAAADQKKAVYEGLIAKYTDVTKTPAFATQMLLFFRDTLKTGADNTKPPTGTTAAIDGPAVFGAQLAVTNGSYMDLLTRASNNCPTMTVATGAFNAGECTNGGPKAGILTSPTIQAQFFSAMAFRRTRFVEETFDCARYPVELTDTAIDVGGSLPYFGKWPFESISSPTNNGGRVNFQDVSAAICANCHQTINHIAPLFAYYDNTGAYKAAISVQVPIDGTPTAAMSDYLAVGEKTAWRFNVPAADIPALGAAMAADPVIAACGVARVWNFALGKTDIVDTLATVPDATITTQLDKFKANGFKLKDLITDVFTSDDFVKF